MSSKVEQQAWVGTWARRIDELGLSPVTLSLIEVADEITHAFGFLGSQALLVAQPLLTGIVNDTAVERTMALLDSPELLDRLRMCLEGGEG